MCCPEGWSLCSLFHRQLASAVCLHVPGKVAVIFNVKATPIEMQMLHKSSVKDGRASSYEDGALRGQSNGG